MVGLSYSNPDVKKHVIKIDSTEFLVLACDGIWDCLKSQDVVSFICKNIAEHKDLKRACEDLMEQCISKTGKGIGTDNMTVIIVGFLYNKTETDWYKWMESRYGVIRPEYKDSLQLQTIVIKKLILMIMMKI
ncbi:PP2C-domain-containing protein [Gigaspora margarita]|uniref:protein-serine/threonine phosphatase n=1 Tax=Gigaspora margarita TaxID=4874 RepID=A0A8H4EJW2_GIGMA|nr:PP2C-domain-containing protein [Gigaspora margarita]